MTDQQDAPALDAALAAEIKAHHAVMIKDLDRLSAALSGDEAGAAKRELETWVAEVLIPHAEEEEATTYRAAAGLPEGKLLIASMLAEHQLIRLTARHMSEADRADAVWAFGRALFDTFDSHQRKENEIILPLLVASPDISLTAVMGPDHGHGHSSHDHQDQADHGH